MDNNNPLVIYAAMWEHQRLPWKVISDGAGSGLYKTTDGEKSWNKIHDGLPKEKGKMAIAVSRSNSDKVYAWIESDSEKELGDYLFLITLERNGLKFLQIIVSFKGHGTASSCLLTLMMRRKYMCSVQKHNVQSMVGKPAQK
jgi:hypothetical protein